MRALALITLLSGCQLVFPLRDRAQNDGDAGIDGPLPDGAKVIFATRETFSGDLGGLIGADAKCADAATAAPRSGTFVAFLSDEVTSANQRMSKQGAYRTTTNKLIADDYDDLIDNALAHAIDGDERGLLIESPAEDCVWTGTGPNGAIAPGEPKCDSWASDTTTDLGLAGSVEKSDAGWVFDCFRIACDRPLRLYCVEQ